MKTLSGVLVAALLLAVPVLSQAADLCLFNASNVKVMVFRGFKMPKPGQCRPVAGAAPGSVNLATGTACQTSDGTRLQMLWVGTNDVDDSFNDVLFMPMPAMTGGSLAVKVNFAANSSSSTGLYATPCKGELIPAS